MHYMLVHQDSVFAGVFLSAAINYNYYLYSVSIYRAAMNVVFKANL